MSDSNVIRLFVGLPLPGSLAGELEEVAQSFRDVGARPIPARNLHLTLRFLGNRPAEEEEAIRTALADSVNEHGPFSMVFGQLGAFSSVRRARVVWVGIEEGVAQLTALQRDVEDHLRRIGFEKDERFHPHVTIARMRRPGDVSSALERAPAGRVAGERVAVDRVVLFRSDLLPSGAEYSVVGDFALGQGNGGM